MISFSVALLAVSWPLSIVLLLTVLGFLFQHYYHTENIYTKKYIYFLLAVTLLNFIINLIYLV